MDKLARPTEVDNRSLRTEHDKETTPEPEMVNPKDGAGIVLTSSGGRTGQKVKVIKIVRRMTGLGLKAAKALVDSAPAKVIGSGMSLEKARAWKNEIEAAGGTAEIIEP